MSALLAQPFDFDKAEALMDASMPAIDLPLVHRFTPGLYIREIFMPAGALVTSVIHALEHPFVVSQGKLTVHIEGGGVEYIEAPYTGITLPGTRRLLFIHEDTTFITFHLNPDNEKDPEVIRERVTMHHVNPYMGLPAHEILPQLEECA